jgi:hypothetical protein
MAIQSNTSPAPPSSLPSEPNHWRSPGGRDGEVPDDAFDHFSAATTRTILYIFKDGLLLRSVPLRVSSASSLAVSDRGEVLIGAQPAEVFLYDAQGGLLWQEKVGADPSGYRPAVRFDPKGDLFLVIEKSGLSAYTIERSQP